MLHFVPYHPLRICITLPLHVHQHLHFFSHLPLSIHLYLIIYFSTPFYTHTLSLPLLHIYCFTYLRIELYPFFLSFSILLFFLVCFLSAFFFLITFFLLCIFISIRFLFRILPFLNLFLFQGPLLLPTSYLLSLASKHDPNNSMRFYFGAALLRLFSVKFLNNGEMVKWCNKNTLVFLQSCGENNMAKWYIKQTHVHMV